MSSEAEPTPEELVLAQAAELRSLRAELEQALTAQREGGLRWNANPDDVQRSVIKLVLTLVDLIRALLERQVIRRLENGTLGDDEIERVGQALMQLERTIGELADQFGIDRDDLNLELGPLGRLK